MGLEEAQQKGDIQDELQGPLDEDPACFLSQKYKKITL
jgi:hypothetical protein